MMDAVGVTVGWLPVARKGNEAHYPVPFDGARGDMIGRLALFFNLDNLTAAIGAAVKAYLMWRSLVFAGGAGDEMGSAQGVVGATTIAATFRDLSFGMRGHVSRCLL